VIITVGGHKGGTGKTTIAVELSMYLARQDKDVLLIDADAQTSSINFCNLRYDKQGEVGFNSMVLQDKALRDTKDHARRYDFTIIDVGGFDSVSQRQAMAASDKYIAVFKPEQFALWTEEHLSHIIDVVQSSNPKLKAYSMLNFGWSSGQDNVEASAFLKESECMTFLDSVINRRKVFADCSSRGISIFERKPFDVKAQQELSELFQNLLKD
jgi:chromosome partitioning protein